MRVKNWIVAIAYTVGLCTIGILLLGSLNVLTALGTIGGFLIFREAWNIAKNPYSSYLPFALVPAGVAIVFAAVLGLVGLGVGIEKNTGNFTFHLFAHAEAFPYACTALAIAFALALPWLYFKLTGQWVPRK